MKKKYLYLLLGIGLSVSCSKEKLDSNSIFVDSSIALNELDKYVEREYTKPYNIAVIYKYVDKESDMNYNLSPANYESSIRMTRLIQYLAIEAYDKVTGSKDFIHAYFPKILNYIGSPAYNNNGTIVLGTAEGGRKISIYNLNQLTAANSTNAALLRERYFHTIHHEFAHILNQNKPFSINFNQISSKEYVNDAWNTLFDTNAKAAQKGFISPYAGKEANEDFVELIAFYVTLTPAQWNARINAGGTGAAGVAGRNIILNKFGIVKEYMLNSWGIDLDILRDEVLERTAALKDFDQLNIK